MTTATPIQRPASAECRTVLADGRIAIVTASRRPRANRADVKCAVPGSPALAARMQQVIRLARHTEARFDSREQVVVSIDGAPADNDRGWELAAVLADRLVRGIWQPGPGAIAAHGWSDAWHEGTGISGGAHAAAALARACPDAFIVTGAIAGAIAEDAGASVATGNPAPDSPALVLPHLGALSGHTDPASAVSTARAWFPLHSGGVHDALAWVEVSVAPWPADAPGMDEEETIAAPELNAVGQLAIRQVLAAARHFDGRALGRWRTVVRFSETRFHGNSYELALVMADRLARGREFVPRGRLIATGCSGAWHTGRVDPVQELPAKLALIVRQAGAGDRILLPEGNIPGEIADTVLAGTMAAIRAQGATMARIARIGMI
ncbi:hypothetical protein [Pseudoduganella rivuli]|uniref:hypothetical protein n=1 Tax=Pseudoduganella rivuli TaxID=2666085 RepID=UPI0035310807